MQFKKITVRFAVALIFLVSSNCEREFSNPVAVDPSTYPSIPQNVRAQIGDNHIDLTWDEPLSRSTMLYHVFRRDSSMSQPVLFDSTEETAYLDRNVRNGAFYAYRVSAIDSSGYEGPLSEEVSAKPGMYALSINTGAAWTNSRDVPLGLVGAADTKFMQVSNDSLFEDARWETFAAERSWELTEGDGEKRVYARFRDAEDNKTAGFVYDSILLDTEAKILTFYVGMENVWVAPGDTIRLILVTGETFGEATVDIGSSLADILLYDDGTHGDDNSNDGTYSLDFVAPPNVDITNAAIVGHFQDHLGNVAAPLTGQTVISIHKPPEAVRLFEPELVGSAYNSLRLSWSANSDDDFFAYNVYRAYTADVDSTKSLVGKEFDQTVNTLVDDNLQENTTYYYRVYVFDVQGLSAGSNVVQGTTGTNLPPASVNLLEPADVDQNSAYLSWDQSNEEDFASYRLYRSQSAEVGNQGSPILVTSTRSTTYYQDTGLQSSTTYYYRLFVYDGAGKSSGSNVVSATTLDDLSPASVELKTPADVGENSVYLSWNQSNEEDFASYKLYRAVTAEVDNQGSPILVAETRDETYYQDTGLQSSTTYYYRVFVYDAAGQFGGSNVVSATTLDDLPPNSVNLMVPVNIGEHSLSLSWGQSNEGDFDSYRLYRSQASNVDNEGMPVFVTDTRTQTYYEDEELQSSTTYYYRVFVYDESGQSNGSNEVSAITLANSPPDPVMLSTPLAQRSLSLWLSWSRNWDDDFDSYRIYRSESANVDSTLTPITIINSQTTTSFEDTQLESNTRYFYRVFVFDNEGLSSGSNEVTGTTLP